MCVPGAEANPACLLAGQEVRTAWGAEATGSRMATRRTVAASVTAHQPAWAAVARRMEGVSRYFSDKASGTGRLLSEEERAAENVYIQVTAD